MTVTVLHAPAFEDNYIWFATTDGDIGKHKQRSCIIIDPGDGDVVMRALTHWSLTPIAIFCTHHHWDHVDGIEEIASRFQIPVYGPGNESISEITRPVGNNAVIELQGFEPIQVLETPGHTSGHISYLSGASLFCGDTLFSGGCGRLFDGTAEQLFDSLNKLSALPDNTNVYCTHEYTLANLAFARIVEPENPAIPAYIERCKEKRQKNEPTIPSTIAQEKSINPFLRCNVDAVKTSVEHFISRQLDSELEVFTELRKWKDGFIG